MPAGAPIEKDEITEVLAHYQPSDVKLGSRLGPLFPIFTDVERVLTSMVENGWIDSALYGRVIDSRFSFKQTLPDMAMSTILKGVSESKNANVFLSMWSTAAGAKRIGDKIVPVMKSDIPGMDAREMHELINERLMREEVSFKDGMDVVKAIIERAKVRGEMDDEEAKEFITAASTVQRHLSKIGVPLG